MIANPIGVLLPNLVVVTVLSVTNSPALTALHIAPKVELCFRVTIEVREDFLLLSVFGCFRLWLVVLVVFVRLFVASFSSRSTHHSCSCLLVDFVLCLTEQRKFGFDCGIE